MRAETRHPAMKVLARRLLPLLLVAAFVGNFLSPRPPAVDFGEWRAVVFHSDDWGLEGWYPASISDSLRAVLSADVPDWQATYLQSTLESADEVEELAGWFGGFRDLDGLPFVLQANTIVAGPSVRSEAQGEFWPVHASGTGPDYFRPGLDGAIDAAIAQGVWWPELHGLTHYDLAAYAAARRTGDALALAAAREGVFAYEGFRRDSELDGEDEERARSIAAAATNRFERRFGRRPVSVIAPDYRWGIEDEAAWRAEGLRVVQARREQIDGSLALHTKIGRLRKWIRRHLAARFGDLYAVERTVDLEPYGDPDPSAPQGSIAAHGAVEAAFRRKEVAVVSVHRAQLVSRSEEVARAGRVQLADLLARLGADGGVRFLLDVEVEQLARRGWSVLERGGAVFCRNWTGQAMRVRAGRAGVVHLPARSSVVLHKFPRRDQESHK